MKSKFLSICERIRKQINEENGMPGDPQQTPMDNQPVSAPEETEPQENQDIKASDEQSELPVASNQEIISVLKSLKNFYGKNNNLDSEDIERIKMLSDDESDENIKNVIKTLNNIFNPVQTIDTNPKNVPNSDFE